MNAVTNVSQGGAVAVQGGYDPFAAYGQEAGGGGSFLKFSKGDWTKGQAEEEVAVGTRFVVNMDELAVGWVRWGDGKPQDRRMNSLVSGARPDPRDALGHDDQSEWETDNDGNLRDPWQKTNELPLVDLETGDQLTFSTSSRGGIGAIGNLCKAYGREYRLKGGLVPVIEVGVDKYKHKDASRGWIKVPVLTIVDWIENSGVPAASDQADNDDGAAEEPAAKKATGSKTKF